MPEKNEPKFLDLEEFSLFRILDKRGLIGFGGIIKNFSKLGGWVFIDELLRKEIKQRIKSAVQGLLQEIENYPPEFIMEAETEKETEKLKQEFIDLVKKWFPYVGDKEEKYEKIINEVEKILEKEKVSAEEILEWFEKRKRGK